jgi:hypothetical protein
LHLSIFEQPQKLSFPRRRESSNSENANTNEKKKTDISRHVPELTPKQVVRQCNGEQKMDSSDDNTKILAKIFMPHSTERREDMKKRKGLFVHYTSAENAIKIIQSKKVWMRNARCMNDYMEVSHGHDLLVKFFSDDVLKKSFIEALDPCGNEIAQKAMGLFDQWWNNIHLNTFISSISEHDPKENSYGRLSMWRAYGQQSAKAAIVFKAPFDDTPNGLKLLLVPTAYFNQEELNIELNEVINNVNINRDFLTSQDDQLIINVIFGMFLMTAVSLKHEGFKEEREWRIIYLPELSPSKLMLREIETINGIPQCVYKIPLEDNQMENVVGLTIPSLIEKVIIGPTGYPLSLYNAFTLALEKAGVENPETRVIVSGIPLRT